MRTIPQLHLPVLGSLLLTAGVLTAQDPAAPTMESLFEVGAISDLDLSPGGTHLLYVHRESDLEGNETRSDIWVARTEGGSPVRLTRAGRNDVSPRWHPEGRDFAFLSDRPAPEGAGGSGRALYRMSAFGGEPEHLYGHPSSIQSFAWSPEGRRIAFLARDEDAEEAREARERGRDVRIEDDPGAYTHLWVLDVATGEAARLTGGTDLTVQSFDWSPDGSRLVISAAPSPIPTESWRSRLHLVDAHDSEAPPTSLATGTGTARGPAWSPDGGWVLFQGDAEEAYRIGYARLYRIPASGGTAEEFAPGLDLAPASLDFDAEGALLFEAFEGTVRGLYRLPVMGGSPVRLTGTRGVTGGAAVSPEGDRIAFAYQDPETAVEVYAGRLGGGAGSLVPGEGAPRISRHHEGAAALALGRTEVLRWRSADGFEVEGLVVYPAGWSEDNGPRAMVTKIHGGPAGIFAQGFQAASHGANAQVYAADGYVTFLPNPRGSTGYGDEVQRMVIEDWGGLDFQDIMTGVDTLVARGVAHPDSLGVMGWSYGGYMTAWAVGQTDRFRAAVVGAGITEPISMWGTQDIIHVFEGYFGGSPWEPDRWEVYQRSSPLAYVRNVTTPTLIIHGTGDERVPPNQASIFHRSLRALEVPTELVWLPRTGHGPSEPGLQYETAVRQKEWMDRWIRGR
jgi:dipeptidyl aminopeptidase/acylaminoacyl peptidase